jgi:hypothetical protein
MFPGQAAVSDAEVRGGGSAARLEEHDPLLTEAINEKLPENELPPTPPRGRSK